MRAEKAEAMHIKKSLALGALTTMGMGLQQLIVSLGPMLLAFQRQRRVSGSPVTLTVSQIAAFRWFRLAAQPAGLRLRAD